MNSNGGPLSPKKKVHLKAKNSLGNTINDVRNNLKSAKDISARNLMDNANPLGDTSNSSDDSTIEEVMMIEEETTEFASESEGEYYEEVIEDSDCSDDSDFEPLPPPLVIPNALRVKNDSDDEETISESTDDGSEVKQQKDGNGVVAANQSKEKRRVLSHDPNIIRPTTVRGFSCESVPEMPKETAKKSEHMAFPKKDDKTPASPLVLRSTEVESPALQARVKPKDPVESQPNTVVVSNVVKTSEESSKTRTPVISRITAKSPTPKTPTRSRVSALPPKSPKTPTTSTTTTSANSSQNSSLPLLDADGRPDVSWTKPDWTKNAKLRATGKSAAGNLAKPITTLPQLVNTNSDDDDRKPAALPKTECKSSAVEQETGLSPQSVTKASAVSGKPVKPYASLHQTPTKTPKAKNGFKKAPKSEGHAKQPNCLPPPPVAAAVDDSSLPSIEWEKPEWTKKKVLRDTSRSEKIKSGQKLERPIGGIKPLDDHK